MRKWKLIDRWQNLSGKGGRVMTANDISMPAALTSPLISTAAASSSAQALEARNQKTNGNSSQDQQASPVDKVTIFNKLQDAKREVRKQDAKAEERKQTRTMQSIQFDYNNKGDLRIKFTDSRSKLVYQTPPVYFAMMSDLMTRPDSSVNTQA